MTSVTKLMGHVEKLTQIDIKFNVTNSVHQVSLTSMKE